MFTFGVKTLMSSFRKRNLAASLWNRLPQLFIQASRTWQVKQRTYIISTKLRKQVEMKKEKRFLSLFCKPIEKELICDSLFVVNHLRMSHGMKHMNGSSDARLLQGAALRSKKTKNVAALVVDVKTTNCFYWIWFKWRLNPSCHSADHVKNISHSYYSQDTPPPPTVTTKTFVFQWKDRRHGSTLWVCTLILQLLFDWMVEDYCYCHILTFLLTVQLLFSWSFLTVLTG